MDPQEQDVYEGFKSIKDRPPSPFLAPNNGGIIDEDLDLDGKSQSFDALKLEDGERNTSDFLAKPEFDHSQSNITDEDKETYTADDFVTAYDEQRVIRRPPNAEIYPDAELKEPERPKDVEGKEPDTTTSKPIAETTVSPDTSPREQTSTNRPRELSMGREPVTASGLDIHSVIGKDGVRMFNALLAAARKDVGLKRAWQLKADIFKCMVKTKLLVDSSKIQLEELEPFKEPLNNLGNLFLQLLADKKKYGFEESAIKPTLFSALCNQLGQMWTKLLEPHMDGMDLAKGQAVVQFLSAPKFITTFLSDSEFVDEKKMMKIHARRILKSKLKPTCVKSKCTKARLAGWSRYCPAHHLARFAHLYEPPNFESFVKGDETAEFLSFHAYFFELIFEAPPGLGGPPVTVPVPAVSRHSLSGSNSNPGSPIQTRPPGIMNGGFALNPENNASPRVGQRVSVISQEKSLVGNNETATSSGRLSLVNKERTGSMDSATRLPGYATSELPASRPSLTRMGTTERSVVLADASTLPKRLSLPTTSPTEVRPTSLDRPPIAESPGLGTRSLTNSDTPSKRIKGLSVVVGEQEGSVLNSPSITTRPVLTSVNSTERAETTLHSPSIRTPPPPPARSPHAGEEAKGTSGCSENATSPKFENKASESQSPKSEIKPPIETKRSLTEQTPSEVKREYDNMRSVDENTLERPPEMIRRMSEKQESKTLPAALPKHSGSFASGSITALHGRHGSETINLAMHMDWNKRLLHLYLDLLRLQACNTVKDRGAVSKQIFDKYLHPDAPSCVNLWRHPSVEFPLPKLTQRAGAVHALLVPINNAMESGLAAVQPGVFMPLFKFVEGVLRTAFESFCASAKYKERLEQFRLPPQFLTALDDKQAEREFEDRLWEESCVVRFDPQLEYIDPVNYSTLPS